MALSGARRTVHKVADKRDYKKIGRLNATIAKAIGVEAGDIVLDENAITHIVKGHSKELEQLGLTAKAYAIGIAHDYNEIYEGSANRLLLVVNRGENHKATAVISLVYSDSLKMWEIVTAQPRQVYYFKNKTLLWIKQIKGKTRQ